MLIGYARVSSRKQPMFFSVVPEFLIRAMVWLGWRRE